MTARWSYVGPRTPRQVSTGKVAPAGASPAPGSVWWQSIEAAWPTAVLLLICGGIAGGWAVTELLERIATYLTDTLQVVVVDGRTTVVAVTR